MSKIPFIEKGSYGKNLQFHTKENRISWRRFVTYITGLVFLFLLMSARLFQLTIVKGVYYKNLSDQNRIREVVIEPQRGKIIDRKGIVIAENTEAEIATTEARFLSKRFYRQPEIFAHVLGYRQLADVQDIKTDPCVNKIKVGDKIGKKGIEKLYDCELRGKSGKKMIEVDALGKSKETLGVVDPIPGETIQLAADSVLQQKSYELIQGKRAVVVGLKPKTGEIVILTSSPSFNPQSFEDGDSKTISKLFNDKQKPLFNRATEGTYPPGSIFKMVIASAALEEKKVTPTTIIQDNGFLVAGTLKFHNWYYLQYGKTDGPVDVYKALQRSNDIYFYDIGARLGAEKMKSWAETFGFQRKTQVGIEEDVGIIPSSFWKEEVLGEKWYLGDTYNLSIGQGYVLATPLQVANSVMPFANNGYQCKPQLLKANTAHAGKPECKKIPITEDTLAVVREGMKRACEPGGTGHPLFDFKVKDSSVTPSPTPEGTRSAALKDPLATKKISIGCKTGTAESHALSGKPHAWFTAFAPYEDPEILVSVLVEEGGQGSDVAGPIVRDILKTYFEIVE